MKNWWRLVKSVYSEKYQKLLALLIEARLASGVTQQQLANEIGRPQSFVSKFERGERRIDVVEFLEITKLIKADPHKILRQL
ncbi:MAG: helix-turn-helix domain-containing protein [Roseovarius sp.]|nr:helix-turn-helix domain-containing protein [Roseovarius sp.]